ncbi:MAG: hypothetical protein AAB922_01935 [Patescibacteria group bacterium]
MDINNSTTPPITDFEAIKQLLVLGWQQILFVFFQQYVWIGIVVILSLICAWRWWGKHKKNRENLLSFKVSQVLKQNCKKEEFSFAKTYFQQLYLPSWQSISFILGIASVLFLVSHTKKLGIFFNSLQYDSSNHYQNLIAIHAGIGAIIFALLIFIAESLRDDETKDRARVLLKESFLFPLTVAEIVVFFIFVWGDINIWAILPLAIVAILTIISLGRLLLVLLSKSLFAKKRLQLLKDRVKKSINLAIYERFGNNVLLQSLGEDKIELEYYLLSLDGDEEVNRHIFYADRTGTIVNIRLNKLDEFAKLVESESNKNGFSFYKDRAKLEIRIASESVSVSQADSEKLQQANRQLLHKKFRDEISDENQPVLSVERRVVKDQEILKRLGILAKEIFIIRKQDNFSEEVKLEINGLKDQFIVAIEGKKLGKIEELIRTYIGLAESFLESLNVCGGGYTYEQARKERGSFMGGWNEVRWLSDSIREIFVKATQTHDQEIIGDVAYLPVAIAIRAIETGDQYVYQEFLSFPSFLYWQALKEKKLDVREFMVDRSWRHLKEMSDFYIEHQLKRKANDIDSVKKYKDFTIPIFIAFQTLLKTAFDKLDFKSFQSFLNQFLELYSDLDSRYDYPSAEHLRLNLKWVKDDAERQELNRKIELREAKEQAAEDIQLKKRQVVFGLAAWIFEKFRQKPSDKSLSKFNTEIISRLSNSLLELTELFASSRQFETERFWDWDNWEMVSDGKVHHIDFHSKLDRLFSVRALLILQGMSAEQIGAIKLPHSRELAFLAEDRSGALVSMLNGIASEPTQWSFVLSQAAIYKIDDLKRLLTAAKKEQENAEEERVKAEKIDPEKLQEFKSEVKKGFYGSGCLRPVLKARGVYRDRTSEAPGVKIPSWGYNQIDEKAAFIKDWHVHYSGWGENYGQGMASSEDQLIFEQMIKGVTKQKSATKQELISEIEKTLAENNLKDPIILQTLDHLYEYENVRKSEAFISRYHKDCPKTKLDHLPHQYMGVFKLAGQSVPVIDVFIRKSDLKNKVLVTDLQELGILNQYSPIDKQEDADHREDIFYLRITDLNEDNERRQKIITDNPEWLREYSDKDGYLRRRVLINLSEKFEFEIGNSQTSSVINVNDFPVVNND